MLALTFYKLLTNDLIIEMPIEESV